MLVFNMKTQKLCISVFIKYHMKQQYDILDIFPTTYLMYDFIATFVLLVSISSSDLNSWLATQTEMITKW